jgi:4-oxalocrotonate tautomerase
VVSVTGEGLRPVIWATIEVVKSGQWTVGGNPVRAQDVLKAIAREG